MTYHELTIGNIRCVVLSDGDNTLPRAELADMFPDSPGAQAALETWTGSLTFSMNCLLIETGHERILVDVGMGTLDPSHNAQLPAGLREVGVTPDQITMVVVTHGHSDHIGGLVTDDGQLVYPNARHFISRFDWEYWTGPALRPTAERCLLPLQDRIELLEPNASIAPGVHTIAAYGHTPGQMAVVIEAAGQKLVHMADAAHHPLQAINPAWSPKFDTDPIQSAQTRRALLEQAAAEGFLVMAYHFAFPGIGTVQQAGAGFRFTPLAPKGSQVGTQG